LSQGIFCRAEAAQFLIQMAAFEHVKALFSSVHALALMHLLARVAVPGQALRLPGNRRGCRSMYIA